MSQLRDDLRRTTEQYREMNQALAQQQQQMTSLQVSNNTFFKLDWYGEFLCWPIEGLNIPRSIFGYFQFFKTRKEI